MIFTLILCLVGIPLTYPAVARITLENPGHTSDNPVDLPVNKGHAADALHDKVLQGQPCQAVQNEHNPVTIRSGFGRHGIIC